MDIWVILSFVGATLLVVLPSFAVSLGQGLAGGATVIAVDEQPSESAILRNMSITGLSLLESAAILSTIVCFLLLFTISSYDSPSTALIICAMVCAIGFPGIAAGFLGARALQNIIRGSARQPFVASSFTRLLLLTQGFIQTPVIFGLILSWSFLSIITTGPDIYTAGSMLCAGLLFGVGSIGSIVGLSRFGQAAAEVCGKDRHAFNHIFSFALISQALIETPILFSLIVALMMIVFPATGTITLAIYASVAFIMGMTVYSCGFSSGMVSSSACKHLAQNLAVYPEVSRLSIMCQTFIDTNVIYAFVITMILFFTVL